VLGSKDIVTRVAQHPLRTEEAELFTEDFFFNTTADFCCKYYERKAQVPKKESFSVDLDRKTVLIYPPKDLTGSSN
jgi:hypothetical protein